MSAKAMIWMWVCSDSQFCSIKSILFVLWSMQKTKHWHPACDKGVLPCHFLSVVNWTLLRDVLPHSCCTWHVPLWVGLRANLFFFFLCIICINFPFLWPPKQFILWISHRNKTDGEKERNKKERKRKAGRKGRREAGMRERKKDRNK